MIDNCNKLIDKIIEIYNYNYNILKILYFFLDVIKSNKYGLYSMVIFK